MNVVGAEATLGATVTDIDLRALDENAWREVEEAFHEYGVLVFPGQHLDPDAQVEFARRFGEIELSPELAPMTALSVSNVDDEGNIVSDPDDPRTRLTMGNRGWHSDSSYREPSAKASMLAAEVVPDVGGGTEWADMRAAYDALSESDRARVEGRYAFHSYLFSQGKVGGVTERFDDAARARMPGAEQPLVRVHPATGRPSLFIGRHIQWITGLDDADAQAWAAVLLESACQPPRVFVHRWEPGDVAIWDNRCVLHRGQPWDMTQPRVLRHTRIAGTSGSEPGNPTSSE